uniref:Uncharacterized protein n=1 Tax=Zea mays TaxID=4577 RepID=B4FLL2_MAIZE|nr:unknown [Zea mays]
MLYHQALQNGQRTVWFYLLYSCSCLSVVVSPRLYCLTLLVGS